MGLTTSWLEGIFGQLKGIDLESRTLLGRFVMRAVKSGDANAFIKRELRKVLDGPPVSAARAVQVTSREVK